MRRRMWFPDLMAVAMNDREPWVARVGGVALGEAASPEGAARSVNAVGMATGAAQSGPVEVGWWRSESFHPSLTI